MRNLYRWVKDFIREIDWVHADMRDLSFRRWERPQDSKFIPWPPAIEVLARREDLVIRAELPGLEPDEVDLTFADGVLIISGERKVDPEEPSAGRYYVREPRYGPFRRSVTLPEDVGKDGKVHAGFEYGMLEVTVGGAAAAEWIRLKPPVRTLQRN